MNTRRGTLLLLGFVSAPLSVGAFFLSPFFGPGLVYSCVVLAPWSRMLGRPFGTAAGTIILGTFAYAAAVIIALFSDYTQSLGGFIGAVLMVAPVVVDTPEVDQPRLLRAVKWTLLIPNPADSLP